MVRRHVCNDISQVKVCGRDNSCGDISMAQLNLLLAVRGRTELTLGDLAETLGVSSPSASVMVDKLVERGMLIRERSTRDRRKVIIGLSSNTDNTMDKVEEKALATFLNLVEEVGPKTAKKWGEVLQEIETVLLKKHRRQDKA